MYGCRIGRATLVLTISLLVAVGAMWLRSKSVSDTVYRFGQAVVRSGDWYEVAPKTDLSPYAGNGDGARFVRSRLCVSSFDGDIVITARYISYDISAAPISRMPEEDPYEDAAGWVKTPVTALRHGFSEIEDAV